MPPAAGPRDNARGNASPAASWASPGHLLDLVRTGQANRRRELQEVTGLSRSTITSRVDQLLDAGLLHESGVDKGQRGRPSSVLAFNQDYGVVLTADLGATHARVAVCDLAGESLVESGANLQITQEPDAVLKWLEDAWTDQLSSPLLKNRRIVGVGVGVPGPVDYEAGRLVRPPIMPDWDGYSVRDRLSECFGVPTFVDNDANVMALGEFHAALPGCPSLLFVKVATGIGAGLVVDGRLIRGIHGGSGDIGHIRVGQFNSERVCSCGARGCLAASVSGGALARRLRELGRPVETSRDAVKLAGQGDTAAVDLLREAGLLIGDVLATSVSLLNPQALMIGGDLPLAQDHFMAALRERLYQRTQPLATRDLRVLTSTLGERSGIVGAAYMVIEEVFSPGTVDRMLLQ